MNTNFMAPGRFYLKFGDNILKNFNYTVVKAGLPDVSTEAERQSFRQLKLPLPGKSVEYADFTVEFIVDETMDNYFTIYQWMIENSYDADARYSDASLIVLDSNNREVRAIEFKNVIPTSLTGLDFDTQQESVEYMTCTLTFAYTHFEFAR